ncbi:MAG: hypothetical protein EAX96_19185 [Candidatus Lokiarchaeota archaeon]|nr:hypothetical protein [Candidatus Lokiarchaeota archaeon]
MILTTGIGSHPINDVNQIYQDLRNLSMPYFPQLKIENMLYDYHRIIPGLNFHSGRLVLDLSQFRIEKDIDEFKNDLIMRRSLLKRRNFDLMEFPLKGLQEFRNFLSNNNSNIYGIKGQITGPLSESYVIKVEPVNKKSMDIPEFMELIVQATSEIAYTIDSELNHLAYKFVNNSKSATIFIDEPLLAIVLKELDQKTAAYYLEEVLKSISGRRGIHICDNIVSIGDFLLDLPINVISFDARSYPKTIQFLDDKKVLKFLNEGGGFALGLTPNTPESLVGEENIEKLQRDELNIKDYLPSTDSLIKDFEEILNDFINKGIDTKLVIKNLILTPQCGFQSFTIPTPERGEQIVRELLLIQEKTARSIEKKFSL